MKLLTQEEVDKLPVRTVVRVIWGGGNGPHIYTLIAKRTVNNVYEDKLDFVGKEKYHDHVEVV